MADIERVGGEDLPPLSSRDKKAYEEEYKEGIDLFEKALTQCASAPSMHQQEAFKDVMARALQVLNDAAAGLRRGDLKQHNEQISQDFQAYGNRKDSLAQRVLMEDLEKAKKEV